MRLRVTLLVAIQVVVAVIAVACGADTTGPRGHPIFGLNVVTTPSNARIYPGDSLIVDISATDSSSAGRLALEFTTVSVSGAFAYHDSVDAHGASLVNRSVRFRLPPGTATTNSVLHISVEAAALNGSTKKSTDIVVTDSSAPPTLGGSIVSSHANGGAVPGETLQIVVNAAARDRLQYVGYRIKGPANTADSIPSTSTVDSLRSSLLVPAGWEGTSHVQAFARDTAGLETTLEIGSLTVAARTRRPIASALPPAPVFDMAYDSRRNRLYMSIPSLKEVAVLSVGDMTYQAPIPFSGTPHGVDLTIGGDSLLVAVDDTAALSVIDLNTGARSVMALAYQPDKEFPPFAQNVRAVIPDGALISLSFPGSGYAGTIVEANFASATSRILHIHVSEREPIAVSGNGSRAVILNGNACCPIDGFSYDAVRGSLSPVIEVPNTVEGSMSVDYSGDRFMISENVFDFAFRYVGFFGEEGLAQAVSYLAADGQSGYLPTASGFARLRLSDGATLESFTLGEPAIGMWMSRDRMTLIARGESQHVYVVDLW